MKFPIGIQNFEDLRNKAFVYVDKTAHIYQLVQNGKYYFLSRPRRFGKSLLISTMEAYFLGKKALFHGLAIEQLEEEWAEYPVLHLDLNTGMFNTEEGVEVLFNTHLNQWEKLYGAQEDEKDIAARIKGIVRRAYEKSGKQVVFLIDEYDKPILQTLDNQELQGKYRATLRSFYSVLKTYDRYIKFAFLTGVTKFSKLSVFSDLNNLLDISMDARYASICGITETEIHTYFEESVQQLSAASHLSYEETCQQLKAQYDGYHFEYDTDGVYNPFSILNTFNALKFSDYWFATGTPTFLVKLLQQNDYDLQRLQTEEVTSDVLGSIEMLHTDPIPLIYQSGYLTIKSYDREFGMYRLGFPNQEVERGFLNFLLPSYVNAKGSQGMFLISRFVKAVRDGDPETFLSLMQTLLNDGDYRIQGKKELYFQNAMFVIIKLMGFFVEAEYATADGRIDLLLKTANYIYVIELKLDGSAEAALQQIHDKGYDKPFAHDPRKLFKIGINLNSETRAMEAWKIE